VILSLLSVLRCDKITNATSIGYSIKGTSGSGHFLQVEQNPQAANILFITIAQPVGPLAWHKRTLAPFIQTKTAPFTL
jgi:hypothetical protein